MRNKVLLFFLGLFSFIPGLLAQGADQDFMRSTGKIYVVYAVILAIFSGIVFFLFLLDRRLTKLENQNFKNEDTR